MPLRIYLAGRVLVEDIGKIFLDERQSMGRRQGRLAFAHLIGERLRAVSRDGLAEELWIGTAPSWERSLSALISKLRALLAGAGLPSVALNGSFGHYQLSLPADVWIDVEAATWAIDRAESALRGNEPREARGGTLVAYRISRRTFLMGEEGPWLAYPGLSVHVSELLRTPLRRSSQNAQKAKFAELLFHALA